MSILVIVCGLLVHGAALADTKADERVQARQHFMAGQTALKANRPTEAISEFLKAFDLTKHPAMLVNIARIYESIDDLKNAIKYQKMYKKAEPTKTKVTNQKIGELRATYASWPAVQIKSQPSGQVVRVADKARPVLGKTPLRLKLPEGEHVIWVGSATNAISKTVMFSQGLSTTANFALVPTRNTTPLGTKASNVTNRTLLVLTVDQAGAQVRIDGKLIGVSPMSGPFTVTPGTRQLRVEGPDGKVHEEVVNVQRGETRQLLVMLGASNQDMSTNDMVMWGSLGLGGASLIAGTAMGLMALDANGKLDDCRSSQCAGTQEEVSFADDVRSKAQMADLFWGCGLVLGTVGTVLWFQDSDSTQENSTRVKTPSEDHWDTAHVWGSK